MSLSYSSRSLCQLSARRGEELPSLVPGVGHEPTMVDIDNHAYTHTYELPLEQDRTSPTFSHFLSLPLPTPTLFSFCSPPKQNPGVQRSPRLLRSGCQPSKFPSKQRSSNLRQLTKLTFRSRIKLRVDSSNLCKNGLNDKIVRC